MDNKDYPGAAFFYTNVGSFMVKPGCVLTAFSEAEYTGDYRDFAGPLIEPNNLFGQDYGSAAETGCSPWAWGSWKCRCEQEMIDCVPTDDYEAVLWCDNTEGIVDQG